MRIDATLVAQPPTATPIAPALEGGLSFETLLPPSPVTQDQAGANAGSRQKIFGFDTLGILGVGGPAGTGHPTLPDTAKGAHRMPVGQARPASQIALAAPDHRHSTVNPSVAGATQGQPPSSAIAESGNGPAPGPKTVPETPKLDIPRLDIPRLDAPEPPAAIRAIPTGYGVAPDVDTAPINESPRLGAIVSEDEPLATETADEAPKSHDPSPTSRFQVESEASSGPVSLTLSEVDGVLNIAAAAPDLKESDRSILRRLTDDAAGDAGLPLGELRLNGVVIPKFSRIR